MLLYVVCLLCLGVVCCVVVVWVVVIFVLSVMHVVGGVSLWVECVFSACRCCVFVSVVHPVAFLSAVFCVICSLLMLVSDASGDHMVEMYEYWSCYGFVCCDDHFFLFPHVVDVSALSICIVLRPLVVVISMCLLYVSLGSRVSHSIFGLMFMGSVMLSI